MISLLRNIRRSLLNEGKLVRYLSYAVGEVLLIVIGILMALKISDWNEGKKLFAAEREVLIGVRNELHANQVRLKQSAEKSNRLESAAYRIIELAANPNSGLEIEAVDKLIGDLNWWQGSIWITGTIDALISSGDISLVRDQSLQVSLSAWSKRIEQVKAIEAQESLTYHELWVPYMVKESFLPQISNTTKIYPGTNKPWGAYREMPLPQTATDHGKLLKDSEFISLVMVRHWDHQDLRENYRLFADEINALLTQIEGQLAE